MIRDYSVYGFGFGVGNICVWRGSQRECVRYISEEEIKALQKNIELADLWRGPDRLHPLLQELVVEAALQRALSGSSSSSAPVSSHPSKIANKRVAASAGV